MYKKKKTLKVKGEFLMEKTFSAAVGDWDLRSYTLIFTSVVNLQHPETFYTKSDLISCL